MEKLGIVYLYDDRAAVHCDIRSLLIAFGRATSTVETTVLSIDSQIRSTVEIRFMPPLVTSMALELAS